MKEAQLKHLTVIGWMFFLFHTLYPILPLYLMILSILLERIKNEEYEVTEEGVYDKDDNVYIDLIRLKLKPSNEYIVICHKPGEERPYTYLPKIIFGEETMDEFYEVLREKQREKRLGDKWEMILFESFKDWKNNII